VTMTAGARSARCIEKRRYPNLSLVLAESNRKLRRFHLSRLQKNTTFVGEIRRFHPFADGDNLSAGKIELVNGTVRALVYQSLDFSSERIRLQIISGIDTVIFGTGYRYAFPFLSQYHNSSVHGEEVPDVAEQPLVTDGTHVRSVWKDFLYIDQPTLAFSNRESLRISTQSR